MITEESVFEKSVDYTYVTRLEKGKRCQEIKKEKQEDIKIS
jgi:hypothetical protein